jgi:hypothetical protein
MDEHEKAQIEAALIPKGIASLDEKQRSVLFEQYKLFVDTMERVVNRRQTAHNFFLSANGFVFTVVGFIAKDLKESPFFAFPIVAVCIVGVILSFTWYRLCRYYGLLNGGKFKVIHLLEQYLPARLFWAEWVALGKGNDPQKYQSFSRVEARMPIVFLVCYAVVIVAVCVYAGLAA